MAESSEQTLDLSCQKNFDLKMPITVAVAGGTGGLGRAIVEAILKRGKEDVIVLSRKVFSHLSVEIGLSSRLISHQ